MADLLDQATVDQGLIDLSLMADADFDTLCYCYCLFSKLLL